MLFPARMRVPPAAGPHDKHRPDMTAADFLHAPYLIICEATLEASEVEPVDMYFAKRNRTKQALTVMTYRER